MGKQYICTIDNVKFADEKNLIDYIKNMYVKEVEDEFSSTIYDTLLKAFPDAEISVKDSSEEDIHVDFHLKKYNSNFEFKIKSKADFSDTYYYSVFSTVGDAITYFKDNFIDKSEEILQLLKENFQFENIEITRLFDGHGDSESAIHFKFNVNNQEMHEVYEFEEISSFLDRMKGHILNVVEGACDIKRGKYGSKEIFINGVNIEDMISRSKRVRFEIIE